MAIGEKEEMFQSALHPHPLHGSFLRSHICYLCNDTLTGHAYTCAVCQYNFHKECARLPGEINSSLHPRHPLAFVNFSLTRGPQIPDCCFCDNEGIKFAFQCPLCEFILCFDCAKNPPPFVDEATTDEKFQLPIHPHPLILVHKTKYYCYLCREAFKDDAYFCKLCEYRVHKKCADNTQAETNYIHHPRHSLALLAPCQPETLHFSCSVCGSKSHYIAYQCSVCELKVCFECAQNPPQAIIKHPNHEHPFNLFTKVLTAPCDSCGATLDNCFPYVCNPCTAMLHKECVSMPPTISILRHHHPMTHTYCLGKANLTCQICQQKIDGRHGGYACSSCNYVTHTKCAIDPLVWDQISGQRDSIYENEDFSWFSFKQIHPGLILHWSHEHELTLRHDGIDNDSERCRGCVLPVSAPFYGCAPCNFFLHEACAKSRKVKRHPIHPHPLILKFNYLCVCSACEEPTAGFLYKCTSGCYFVIDLRCGSISHPLTHESHAHPLHFIPGYRGRCSACVRIRSHTQIDGALRCVGCDFTLDFRCATLPREARHKYDEHPLRLCYGDPSEGQYWCEICEEETDKEHWFYACDDCPFTPHIKCVLGKTPFLPPGW